MTLFQILAVFSEAGPTDAASVLERLDELLPAREVPSLPAFYRHVRRATELGWIAVDGTEDPAAERGGRPARLFRLTPAGADAVRGRALEIESITRLALGGERS